MLSPLLKAPPSQTDCPRDRLPSSTLLDVVTTSIITALTCELRALGLGSIADCRSLWLALGQNLIRVQDQSNGLRRVSICLDRSVFLVPVCQESSSLLQDLFPVGRAIGLCARPHTLKHDPIFWDGLSHSQWRSTLQDWLMQELIRWMRASDSSLEARVDIGGMAAAGVANIDSYVPHLQWLLMDAMGYPRALVRFGYRNLQRELAPPKAETQEAIIRYWPMRAQWYGRALKLFPLALALAGRAETLPDVQTTRDMLVQRGLSRNAWAMLYRMPASVISLIANDLRFFSDEEDLSRYLSHFSFWCSRLGAGQLFGPPTQQLRYLAGLTIYRRLSLHPLHHSQGRVMRLVYALLWPVRELTILKNDCPMRLAVDDMESCGFTLRLHNQSRLDLLRYQHYPPDLHDRLQWMLLSFSRQLLQSETPVAQQFPMLESLMDWFRHEAMSLPVQAFKRPFPALFRLSERWHAQQVERPGYMTWEDQLPSSWTSVLPLFESEGARFEALLTRMSLAEEGTLMQHCVASYARDCIEQRSLIYAVSFRQERVGTLEMRRMNGQWRIKQFKGIRNYDLMETLTHPGSYLHIPYQEFLAALMSASAAS